MRNKIKIHIKADILDKDGKIIKRGRWKLANSLVKAFSQGLQLQFSQLATNIIDTTNNNRSLSPHSTSFGCNAGIGITTTGIVVGTGETAVAMTDYKLETQVTVNVGHAASSVSSEAPDANSYRTNVIRQITNNTGALLTITEVGLYCTIGASTYYYCIDRTLYNLPLASGTSVVLTYRFTISL